MGKDVFKRYPDKRKKKKALFWKGSMDFCANEREKSPEKRQKKGKEDIDSNTHSRRQISVVSGYRRNPVNQNGVVRKSGKKTQKKGLFRAFFQNNGEKRNERDPGKKGKVELGERKSCKDST
jgi:hypothetical protein